MEKLARFFSILGHPLLVGPAYVGLMAFDKLSTHQALLLLGMVLGVVTIPIIIHNFYKVKKGSYTNFDVSQREQRKGFYPFLLGLFSCINLLIYYLDFPQEVSVQTGVFTGMLLLSFAINYVLKASLHTAILFYICFSLLHLDLLWVVGLLIFAVLTAWSRVYTQKHQVSEVLVGGVLGAVFGFLALQI
ncbi:phosphatase PAP2 family protein [Mongoliitalea daihaiensis]|uniref:phosphatase PAP2 family protein n=1 Tax=Mongoliitalea daihaiensis TaxID=2782006 RepID=UPI001F2E7B08|nr:phosphatase PAP2 family protein [Mongoliitalea daihaiensis]UJP63461.1 phosphatase PAP2 family protein [Mongoliitalea daihaiensis]